MLIRLTVPTYAFTSTCILGRRTHIPLPFCLASSPCQGCAASSAEPRLEGTKNNSTRLPMNTKITLELTPEQIRFLRYVAELEGLTVEQYLLRFAKGQIVRPINSQKS